MKFQADKNGNYAPGIYFGMSNEDYHADSALGSSSIKMLRQSPFDWWYQSPLNPRRPKKKETDPLVLGSAYHTMVLEGPEAFARGYMRRPDDADDAKPSEKAATTKAANAAAEAKGKESLHGDDYDRVLVAADMIHQHPDLATAFKNGIAEVSVFFEFAGIKQKVRIDYLKLGGFGDLKSIANERRRPMNWACPRAIEDYRIDMSLAHYTRGRSLMPAMITDGMVYGDHDATWLKKLAAKEENDYAAQLVFIQKSGAPLVWSKWYSPENPRLVTALIHVDEGLHSYKAALERFGTDHVWVDPVDVSEIKDDDFYRDRMLDRDAAVAR